MVELASEPLYILAQVRLKLQLRVVAEAAATLARGVLTLALLKTAACDVAITLSLAQVFPPPHSCCTASAHPLKLTTPRQSRRGGCGGATRGVRVVIQ